MINKVTLIGNLGKDPEVRHLENGASVARFSVATNESYKDKAGEWQNRTEWHIVVVWRYLAELAERDLKKGSMVYVEGRLRTRTYQDSNGVEKSITEVEGQILRALDRRERSGDGGSSFPSEEDDPYSSGDNPVAKPIQAAKTAQPTQSPQPTKSATTTPPKQASVDEMPEDDLPF